VLKRIENIEKRLFQPLNYHMEDERNKNSLFSLFLARSRQAFSVLFYEDNNYAIKT